MKKQAFFFSLAMAVSVLFAQQSFAQRGGLQTALGGGIQTSIPVGDFSDQFDGTPVGLAATFTAPTFINSPIHGGFGFAWNRIGSSQQDIFVPSGEGFASGDYEVVTNRYTYDVHVRLSPFRGRMQPYIEGLAGWSNYITRADLDTRYANGEIGESTERLHNDMSWNYGWGVGVHVRLMPYIFLEGKVQRVYGSETSFLDHESMVIQPSGQLDYDMITGRPQFVTVQVGLTFKF